MTNGKSLKRSLSNTKTESNYQDGGPPEYLLPGSTERPLMALLPASSQPEVQAVNIYSNIFYRCAIKKDTEKVVYSPILLLNETSSLMSTGPKLLKRPVSQLLESSSRTQEAAGRLPVHLCGYHRGTEV